MSSDTSTPLLKNAYRKGLGKAQHPFACALALGAIVILALGHLLYYAPRAIDDMFIFLRYAEHLAQGKGLTYNSAERVEGFSSPLWLALLTVGILVGVNPVTWAKGLSVAAFGFLLAGVYRFGREEFRLPWGYAGFACGVCALNSYLVAWTSWGLETPLYLALMLWFAILLARLFRPDQSPGLNDCWKLSAVGMAFMLSRPEAPLFAALISLAASWEAFKLRQFRSLLRRGLPAAAIVTGGVLAYLVFRRLYFGLWLPHTHYAKPSNAIDVGNLLPLISHGASSLEIVLIIGGLGIALWLACKEHKATPLAILLATLIFVVLVPLDWMPSLRHFLPIWIVVPLMWCWLASAWAQSSRFSLRIMRHVPLVVLAAGGLYLSHIDARYSDYDFASHGRGQHWIRPKSLAAWEDTLASLNRVVPAHIQAMDNFNHGMISQVYRLFEADARPLEKTWYIGRDIGRLGWLAPVQVFDTDGLFTPDVVQSSAWRHGGGTDEALLRRAFSRPVVMTEISGPWEIAAARSSWLQQRYSSVHAPQHWIYVFPRYQVRPTSDQILARYRNALEKLPSNYYLMTLYGEAVGAAVERRYHFLARTMNNPHLE